MEWIFDSIGQWIKNSAIGALFGSLEPAMLTFLILGIVGAIFLLLSFLLDGLFDVFDFGGDGPLSLTTISAFISIFGFSALSASAMGFNANAASIAGALVGVLGATGSFWMTRSMKRMESHGHEESSLAGYEGVITIPIPANGLGEVAVFKSGERLHMAARSSDPIGIGTQVLVESVISSSSVLVAPKGKINQDRSSMESPGNLD